MQKAILKSFTYNGSGGNGAGVVICSEAMSDECMQSIASDIGLSETAFVTQAGHDSYDVRFFTPVCEVELCGHATVAAFYYMGETGMIKGSEGPVKVYQNTKAGRLKIEVVFKNNNVEYVLMQQSSPRIFRELTDEETKSIAESLNIDPSDIALNSWNVKPTIVSTGIKDILIPVRNTDILNSIKPDYEKISSMSSICDVVGYHVYTEENGRVHARNFAPLVGIPEECATGTSNGALGGLLSIKGIIGNYMEVIQGEAMGEPSLICVKAENDAKDIHVGGKAAVIQYDIK